MRAPAGPLLSAVAVGAFRTARDIELTLGGLTALVGEADAGKSNLLAAIRAVLDPAGAPIDAGDVPHDGDGGVHVRAQAGGAWIELSGAPPHVSWSADAAPPPVLFLPAAARSGDVFAPPSDGAQPRLAARAVAASDSSAAHSLAPIFERWLAEGATGMLLLIEEPELFLGPQAQRYLYRLLRRFAVLGNQVVYSTHSPAFLNVAKLHELVFVRRRPGARTRVFKPGRVQVAEPLRIQSEFDADRSELFLARAAMLVEGQTERLALPFVFEALGLDADREGIAIVECGGKASMPLIAEVAKAAGVPFVAIHDRDAPPERKPSPAHRALNAAIAHAAGPGRTVVLSPDFEAIAGLHRHEHKPQQAWRRFAQLTPDAMPEPLERAVRQAVRLAETA